MPSSIPTYGDWAYADPTVSGSLTFPVDMDQTATPDPSEFILLVDGIPKTPDSVTWADATTLGFLYDEALLGPSAMRMQYPQMFHNFLSIAGQPVFPFDLTLTAI